MFWIGSLVNMDNGKMELPRAWLIVTLNDVAQWGSGGTIQISYNCNIILAQKTELTWIYGLSLKD